MTTQDKIELLSYLVNFYKNNYRNPNYNTENDPDIINAKQWLGKLENELQIENKQSLTLKSGVVINLNPNIRNEQEWH